MSQHDSIPTIPEFFRDRDIFITGGTGFIGKVLIEKLLRSCPDLNKIFLLVRPKKNQNAQERISALQDCPLFDLLKEKNLESLDKMVAVNGDVEKIGLGLSDEDKILMSNVSVVFHSAASVRFDDPLHQAVIMNTRGTREVMLFAETLVNLTTLIHVSTTYFNPLQRVVCERPYPPSADWKATIKLAEEYPEMLDLLTDKYINFEPNTYTFTKGLSEQVAVHFQNRLPVVIFRPSIVISAMEEPLPGWIDNFNGPIGLLLACGIGIMRTTYGDPDIVSDFTPVDTSIKAMIVAAWKRGTAPSSCANDPIVVYNCSTSLQRKITTGFIIKLGEDLCSEIPMGKMLWKPGGCITRCRFDNFIKYVKHDISDWIGERDIGGNELNGFKWRGGLQPQTTGIWIWSEIFTHDFDNGDRVAIILLDTQGIFDHESSTMEYTSTFAISAMLSSVQCYNVMQNVQEDDLQNLDFFTQYGRLAKGQSNKKPFQKLLFLVRDWPYADDIDYGYSPKYVERILDSSSKQSSEKRELRDRIKSSFENIAVFLLPYPGTAVAEGKNTNGNLRLMDEKFVQFVKVIVPSLFAPENLVVKQINGKKIRAHDFSMYLEKYAKIFNSKTLPEPKAALLATAGAGLVILHRDSLHVYVKKMQEAMDRHRFFHSISDLSKYHEVARKESLQQYENTPKFDFPGPTSSYRTQLENDIADQFKIFKELNEERVKLNEYWMKEQTKEKGWGVVRNFAVSGLYGGFCAYLRWNPIAAGLFAAARALLSS